MAQTIIETMTFEEWKTRILLRGPTTFTETGKHGWTTIDDILDKKPGGRPGPHWCDASPLPRSQRMYGTYYFNHDVDNAYFYEW